MIDRRSLLVAGPALVLATGAAARQTGDHLDGRLTAMPGQPDIAPRRGDQSLGLGRRDAWLFVPENLDLNRPAPLVLALHGAGEGGLDMIEPLRAQARRLGFVVVAPSSRGASWALDDGPVGPDAAAIDSALVASFQRVRIDPARMAVLGMSDGASYALSCGMVNGDRFSHVLAHAPLRFVAPSSRGRPAFYISIGARDRVSGLANVRGIADQLREYGYDVELARHGGGHIIDRDQLREGLERFLAA